MSENEEFLQEFEYRGFVLLKAVVSDVQLSALTNSIEELRRKEKIPNSPGVRHLLRRSRAVRKFAKSEIVRRIAAQVLGDGARPVKAILFDKTPDANWYVTWHQDLTIAVEQHIDVEGFGPWSVKDGIPHVQPPANVLKNIVSLRIHLDSCPQENGALKFISGSHRIGIMETSEIAEWRDKNDFVCCSAERGDVIVMRPLILHSSSQSTQPDHRRVLHIEYVGAELPCGLKWAEASGLDSVELVMAIEEEYGIEIPDKDAERMTTVGEMYEFLKTWLSSTPAVDCLTQKIFYKLRRALMENYQVSRRSITPDTKLSEIISPQDLEDGWPFLQMFIDLKTPNFKASNELLGFKLKDRMLTMRELVSAMISINPTILAGERDTDQEIWRRMVEVIIKQLNVNRDDVVPQASFSKDLGVC